MSSKKTTLDAAEKRVIKAEIKTLTFNHKKMLSEATKAAHSAHSELMAAQKRYKKTVTQIDKALPRETAKIQRRVAILVGRLHS